jgi:hypothetical protein
MRRTIAGQRDDDIARAVTAYAHVAFDALEPALAGYAVRPGPVRRMPR